MLIVGLTGNYGMGKSTVLPMFKKFGAVTIDADEIVKSLLTEKNVIKKIRGILGNNILNKNGTLNKKKIADAIFKDESMRHSVEDILHPLVFDKIDSFLEIINGGDKVIIIEVPVLFERGYRKRFDRVITVYTKEDIALNRLEKKGVDRQAALLRLKTQLPIEEKIERSDFAINNSGSIEETMAQAEILFKKLTREAKDGNN